MAEHERDPELSQRYRALGAEEPPAELDAKILAASRRAVGARPGQRWYLPLAAAAVLVLAVAVGVQVERQQPEMEQIASAPAAPPPARDLKKSEEQVSKAERQAPAEAAREAPKRAVKAEVFAADPKPQVAQAPSAQKEEAPPAAPAAAPPPVAAASAPRAADAESTRAERPQSQTRALAKMQSPEQELERIVQLRKEGRDEEADKALAEFKRRYPDFKIPEMTLEKVEKR